MLTTLGRSKNRSAFWKAAIPAQSVRRRSRWSALSKTSILLRESRGSTAIAGRNPRGYRAVTGCAEWQLVHRHSFGRPRGYALPGVLSGAQPGPDRQWRYRQLCLRRSADHPRDLLHDALSTIRFGAPTFLPGRMSSMVRRRHSRTSSTFSRSRKLTPSRTTWSTQLGLGSTGLLRRLV